MAKNMRAVHSEQEHLVQTCGYTNGTEPAIYIANTGLKDTTSLTGLVFPDNNFGIHPFLLCIVSGYTTSPYEDLLTRLVRLLPHQEQDHPYVFHGG